VVDGPALLTIPGIGKEDINTKLTSQIGWMESQMITSR